MYFISTLLFLWNLVSHFYILKFNLNIINRRLLEYYVNNISIRNFCYNFYLFRCNFVKVNRKC